MNDTLEIVALRFGMSTIRTPFSYLACTRWMSDGHLCASYAGALVVTTSCQATGTLRSVH